MKKTLAIILAVVMLFAMFAACGKKDTGTNDNKENSGTQAGNSGSTTNKIDTSTSGSTVADLKEDNIHPSDDATFRIAANQEPAGLTQPGRAFGSNMDVSQMFYETLIGWDSAKMETVPRLATEWEWVDDLTLRLKLRDDVTSINGDKFTANDVLFTFQWNCDVTALASYYSSLIDIDNCKVVDEYTIDIAVKSSYPYLPIDLAHRAYHIAVEASVEAAGGKDAVNLNPIAGTGPYKMTKWEEGSCVYMERRDDYWGNTPYYKYIEWHTATDATARVMGVEAGDYDTAMMPSMSQVVQADTNDKLTAWKLHGIGVTMQFGLNSDAEPLNVKEVRQAIALAVNYEAILQIAGSGLGEMMDGLLTSNASEYVAPAEGDENYFHYDVEAAKAKLTEAGYADGFTINCKYKSNDQQLVNAAELLKNQLGQININIDLMPQESAVWSEDMRSGNYDTFVIRGGQINPKRMLQSIDSRVDYSVCTGGSGYSWMPEELGPVIDTALSTIDETEKMEAYTEIQKVVREYVPMIFLYQNYQCFITSSNIVNLMTDSQNCQDMLSMYPAEYIEG